MHQRSSFGKPMIAVLILSTTGPDRARQVLRAAGVGHWTLPRWSVVKPGKFVYCLRAILLHFASAVMTPDDRLPDTRQTAADQGSTQQPWPSYNASWLAKTVGPTMLDTDKARRAWPRWLPAYRGGWLDAGDAPHRIETLCGLLEIYDHPAMWQCGR